MAIINRRTLSAVGAAAVAVAASSFFLSTPAQAASAGLAKVVGTNTVQFQALIGRANSLTVTISGRTVTLTDRVALQAGKGCKKVTKYKVRCTTKAKTTRITAALGDKNDVVNNKTSVYLLAGGGTGNDTLIGGSGGDQLQGGSGNDKLYGNNGNDKLFGESGVDHIRSGNGNDSVWSGTGNDKVWGDAGNDDIWGSTGNDALAGGPGNDYVDGEGNDDWIYGDAGDDELFGGDGNDTISGANDVDYIDGENGNDRIYSGAGERISGDNLLADVAWGGNGNDTIHGENDLDYIFGGAGSDKLSGGGDFDWIEGDAANDLIWGNDHDDVLIGESVDAGNNPVGSPTAADAIDGGAHGIEGDTCIVMGTSTVMNCEIPPAEAQGARKQSAIPAEAAEQAARVKEARASRR
ncbi:calcium-binding protein [Actinoplanes sp. NPDC023801]|uniref:calcium-binding protein n=1 Tax=Actinoplanes sp. NPDC023801 TaxID=3154595 RepID=UPI0033FCDB95